MPVYDYKCDECGNRFERRQSFSDDPISVCPKCGGRTRRVIHAPGIVFKGTGFYKTDSRSTAASDSTETPADGAAKSEEKPADAPAEKTEAKPASDPVAPAATPE